MLFPELFHRLQEAGATEIELKVRPGNKEISYDLTWSYANRQYGHRYIASDLELAQQLHPLTYIFAVISDNALLSIHRAKTINTKGIKMRYVTVNFTGSPTAYTYSFDPYSQGQPAIGDRVVVPTKMKGDGTVTLTIATVVALSDTPLPNADKPVIAFLSPAVIAGATAVCARLEAERVQVIS